MTITYAAKYCGLKNLYLHYNFSIHLSVGFTRQSPKPLGDKLTLSFPKGMSEGLLAEIPNTNYRSQGFDFCPYIFSALLHYKYYYQNQ